MNAASADRNNSAAGVVGAPNASAWLVGAPGINFVARDDEPVPNKRRCRICQQRKLLAEFAGTSGGMSKRAATRIEHLIDIALDAGYFLRLDRRYWADGSSCLHIAKWGTQPNTGRDAPYKPLQYVQIRWEIAERVIRQMVASGILEVQP